MDKYYYYHSYHEALKGLPAKTRYIIREAIDRYMFDDLEPVFPDTLSKSIWLLILPTLKLSKVRYANGKQKRSKLEANQELTESKSEANSKQNRSKVEDTPVVCSSISKEKGERIKEKDNPPIIPPRGVVAGFEKFWEAYPRKVGKQVAAKAYDRARKMTSLDNMLSAIERQKHSSQWKKDNGAYIPHPATWLNQGRWEDEKTVVETERPRKEITDIKQCPKCGSFDIRRSLDYGICDYCGCGFRWNYKAEKWESEE